VLGITLVFLLLERSFGIGIFDPAMAAIRYSSALFLVLFASGRYIMDCAGMAIISEVIPTFSKKTISDTKPLLLPAVSIALVDSWSGDIHVSSAAVSFAHGDLLVPDVPGGDSIRCKSIHWLATMYRGSISLQELPCFMLFHSAAVCHCGLTGIFLGALSTDIHLTDTYFVVAHFHYVMMEDRDCIPCGYSLLVA